MKLKIDPKQNRFSYLHPEGGWGWQNLKLQVMVGQQRQSGNIVSTRGDGEDTILELEYSCGLKENARFTQHAKGLRIQRTLFNPNDSSVSFESPQISKEHKDDGPTPQCRWLQEARFAHLDNLRTELYPKCRAEYPFLRPLPWTTTRFGDQESQTAPYMIYTSDLQQHFCMESLIEQNEHRLVWDIGLSADGHQLEHYKLQWSAPGKNGFTLHSQQRLVLETLQFSVHPDSHLDDVIRHYYHSVIQHQQWEQRVNPLSSKGIYCTWNYGPERDIHHDQILERAKIVKDNFPDVEYFLIDGGWVPWEKGKGPHLGNFNGPIEEVYDHQKFPHGMDGVAKGIKDLGLRPALHWTPFVRLNTKLAMEHEAWLCRNDKGDLYRIGDYGYLDYSIPEVQNFLEHVFRTICHTWGFEGFKIDFWSQSVESNDIRYRHGGTGIVWRDWLLATMEKFCPDDGFVMSCIAMGMGNPFIGKHARTYRCCYDIGLGSWRQHLWACSWVQPLLLADERHTALHNLDGLGIQTELSDAENLHRLSYGFITMGSLEIDGEFEKLSPKHMDWLKRLCQEMDRGHAVTNLDQDVNTGRPLPKALMVTYPKDSKSYQRGIAKHIALFNWNDQEQWAGASSKAIGYEGQISVRDFWSDDIKNFGPEGIAECLPPRSSRLYEISR